MLQKMNRIQVVGPKKDFNAAVDVLYRTGTVHLEDVSECVPPDVIGLKKVEMEHLVDIPNVLVKINGIFYTLPTTGADPGLQGKYEQELSAMAHEQVLERANKVIADLEWTTKDLALRKSDQEFAIAALNRYEKVIKRIKHMETELPLLEGYEINIFIIQKEFEKVLGMIREELTAITRNQFEFIFTEVDEEAIAAITVYHRKYSEQVHAFVFAANVNEVRLPPEYYGLTFNDMLVRIAEQRRKASEDIVEINRNLTQLATLWYQELSVLKRLLEDINEEVNTFSKFGQSEYTFVIQGWVPAKFMQMTADTLKQEFGSRVVMEALEVTSGDLEHAPTFYDNPRVVKPFEFFMKLVKPPKYKEIDPSPLMAVFFPIFFGIMVGDIGYGLVILALSLVVKARFKKAAWLQDLANIMLISSLPTILFGVLFGEFFGNLGEEMGWLHPLHLGITWNRIEAIIPMLIFVIAIGVFHVFLGLGVGLYNAWIVRSRKHMIEKIGTVAVLVGLGLCLGGAANLVPGMTLWVGLAMLLVSIPLVFYGGGIFGTIELVSAVGNILSYARLMAIGMASVILAMVANEFAGALGVAAVGITFAVCLHGLNIALAMFSPSIHALRLHMVEFFSKFYHGGGRLYRPFKKMGRQA